MDTHNSGLASGLFTPVGLMSRYSLAAPEPDPESDVSVVVSEMEQELSEAICRTKHPQCFMGVSGSGHASLVMTMGNELAHCVLCPESLHVSAHGQQTMVYLPSVYARSSIESQIKKCAREYHKKSVGVMLNVGKK